MSAWVHVAITRRVKKGQEAEFERRLKAFFERADAAPGTRGAYLLKPLEADGQTYGILRAFEDEAAKEAFYRSDLYGTWNEEVAELVEGGPERRELHGLEAFFRGREAGAEPPAWKMAILTWIAVNPAVWIFANGVPKVAGSLPPLVELLVVNAFVVATLTWAFMPLLVRLAGRWLRQG